MPIWTRFLPILDPFISRIICFIEHPFQPVRLFSNPQINQLFHEKGSLPTWTVLLNLGSLLHRLINER